MQGRFKRDSGAAGDPEQQSGGAGNGATHAAAGSGSTAPGTTAATGRASTSSGIEAGRITGLGGKGSRIAVRNWRISTRLVSVLALPVVAASALGGLRIQSSLDNINQLEHMKTLTDITEHATDLAAALQEERDSSAGPLSQGQTNNDAVAASREATQRELTLYEGATDNISADDPIYSGVRATLLSIGTQLGTLSDIRDTAYTDESGIAQTVNQYDGLITSLLSLSQDMAQATNNHEMISATRALAAFSSAKEYESIQRAVISAAFATGGTLTPNDYQTVHWAFQDEDTALSRFQSIYGADAQTLLDPMRTNDTIAAHDTEERRIAGSLTGITKIQSSYLDWDDAAKTKIQAMNQIERSLLNDMQQKSLNLQSEAKQSAIISGAIILLVLGVAVVGAFVVARSMIRSLRRLQQTAQDVAQKRLPELVKQLSESDPQDVDTSVESIGINSRDEIGKVARAFDEVHSEAVRLAAEQALLRGNVNAMFTNLSRRSQGLIQRQLSLISELESREADPDQLSSLFKLDHLATRMRRNGENLLVLAGEEPGRRWTRPVPLVDVLRAAASEVEQYERIELTAVPTAEVTGRIVNDLVHLLAELLENATSFSSPQTKVRVTGHSLPDGRVLIEIHDTGIGLSPEDLADINERLANPPTVDVSVSRRMGLFVVGRLSLRHGIRIQLRPSDSGGTTALVMLPVDVTQGGAVPKSAAGRPPAAASAAQGAGTGTGIAGAFNSAPRVGGTPQRGQVGSTQSRPAIGTGGPSGSGAPGRPNSGGPGGSPQQPGGPRWAAQGDSPGFGDDRGQQDTPRGHEDVEAPSFDAVAPADAGNGARADFKQGGRQRAGRHTQGRPGGQPGQGGPQGPGAPQTQGGPQGPGAPQGPGGPQAQGGRSGTGFPPPQPQNTGPGGFRSDVFGGRPGPTPRQGQGSGPGDTAQFPAIPDGDLTPTGLNSGGNQGDQGRPGQSQGQGPGQGGGRPGAPQRGGPGRQGPSGPGQGNQGQGNQGQGVQGGGQSYGQQDPFNPSSTGQFAVPGLGGNVDETAQFPQIREDGSVPTGLNNPNDPGNQSAPGGQTSSIYGGPGQYRGPQQPAEDASFPGQGPGQGAPQGRGQRPGGPGLPQRGQRGSQGTPGWDGPAAPPVVPTSDPYETGTHRLPGRPGESSAPYSGVPNQFPPQTPERRPAPQQRSEPQLPPAAEPMALPPAPTRGDEPTPIFAAMESDWFRTGQAERMQQVQVEQRGQQAPSARPVGRTAPPQRPRTEQRPTPGGPQRQSGGSQPAAPAPQPTAQASQVAPAAPVAQPLPRETPNWRTSPNDALRQRAEAVREPSAGGVTPSGLPRRVPRANLVAGGAAPQQAPQGGPQVSRSPDDVRGRLTNLRRGIQQGRQAGGHTDGRGFGTNSQER